jgi:hypothetical protein
MHYSLFSRHVKVAVNIGPSVRGSAKNHLLWHVQYDMCFLVIKRNIHFIRSLAVSCLLHLQSSSSYDLWPPRGPVIYAYSRQRRRQRLRPRVHPEQPLARRLVPGAGLGVVAPRQDLGSNVERNGGVTHTLTRPVVGHHVVKVALQLGHRLGVVKVALRRRDRVVEALEHGLPLVDGLDVLLVVV